MRPLCLFVVLLGTYSISGQEFYDSSRETCPHMSRARFNCRSTTKFASFDGSCNNLKRPWVGQLNTEYKRYFEPQYSDGSFAPRIFGFNGRSLTNPRVISRVLSNENNLANPFFSHMLPIFGQFVAHDLTRLATTTGYMHNF
jgi:hypothetical protein